MAIPPPGSALRMPASRRITTPSASRLTAIIESPPPIPVRNPSRGVSYASLDDVPPPSYRERLSGRDHLAELDLDEHDGHTTADDEKLAQLRQQNNQQPAKFQRGGWGRLILTSIAALIFVAVALGIGLGVGLKRHHSHPNGGSADTEQIPPRPSELPFPIGQWRIETDLRSVGTNCTSNPATWRCFPYAVYDPSSPTSSAASQATFDWVIANTSVIFAGNSTEQAPSIGAVANLSISATDNPFSVSFTNQTLVYHDDASNSSSARLTFSFEMSKAVIPTVSLTGDNSASECFFNGTIFTATLYLGGQKRSLGSSTWPFAVEVVQTSSGGTNVPACYDTGSGNIGPKITSGINPQDESAICSCRYSNFGE